MSRYSSIQTLEILLSSPTAMCKVHMVRTFLTSVISRVNLYSRCLRNNKLVDLKDPIDLENLEAAIIIS